MVHGRKTHAAGRAIAVAACLALIACKSSGFYHDGRFTTLDEVVAHYGSVLALGLSAGQQSDLVEYLKSL